MSVDTIKKSAVEQHAHRRPAWLVPAAIVLLVVALVAGGIFGYQQWQSAQQAARLAAAAKQRQEVEAAIVDRLGIRVTRVVVTADGGLVDLRYQIVDPDKANFLFTNLAIVPKMLAPDGTEIAINSLPHRHDLQAGLQYFILYRNVNGSVKPGSTVTVTVGGDLRLENFPVAP